MPVSGSLLEDYSNYLNYQIQPGDVLSEIAIRFGVTVESINKINNIENKSIYPGQVIKINI
jgi:N-acetylmuramoyl-L-alanine amidase